MLVSHTGPAAQPLLSVTDLGLHLKYSSGTVVALCGTVLNQVSDEAGQSIQTSIIPAIAVLHKQHSQIYFFLFSPHLLIGQMFLTIFKILSLYSEDY
jgi:hypothetical protein